MNPGPSGAHQDLLQQLSDILSVLARDVGLFPRPGVNVGESDNFRSPDAVIQRERLLGVWHPTAALAVEVLSPHDETWQKLPHYAEHGVDELVIVDPRERTVTWLALADGEYRPAERSQVIDASADELAAQLDWPPLTDD